MLKGLLWSAPVAAALVLALAGCGSDDTLRPCPPGQVGTPPNCSAPPPPCTQTAVLTESGPVP
ncbi:MAG TPA: hypothetical protein VFQ51_03910, partial [Vicinamibacteria bacterium]|nr:hypothetical protein [Vicinamibacteria bacterium]